MSGLTDKSIKKYARHKIESWLDSIKDDNVRILAKRNVILTGGSIASMILGEKVNDFDLYFKTKEAAEAVANYYINLYLEKNGLDPLDIILTEIKDTSDEDRLYIKVTGYGVDGEDDGNDDAEVLTPEDELDGKTYEDKETDEPYQPVFITGNAISLSGGIQIIVRFYGIVDEIHKNFDFIHATCSYDYDINNLVTPIAALRALQTKRLYYVGSKYPICSLFRIRKFMDRGWRISAAQITKIAFQISELDLKDKDVLLDQLVGVDYTYMKVFIDALENVPAEELTSTYMGEIIDRVFGENI